MKEIIDMMNIAVNGVTSLIIVTFILQMISKWSRGCLHKKDSPDLWTRCVCAQTQHTLTVESILRLLHLTLGISYSVFHFIMRARVFSLCIKYDHIRVVAGCGLDFKWISLKSLFCNASKHHSEASPGINDLTKNKFFVFDPTSNASTITQYEEHPSLRTSTQLQRSHAVFPIQTKIAIRLKNTFYGNIENCFVKWKWWKWDWISLFWNLIICSNWFR